jgi:sodium-dependent dicarboxylate transporter 2/3/5
VFADLPLQSPVARVACVCLLMTFLTEITSNTATTLAMLPILAEAAPSMGLHPMALMIPATVSASCAFMLPVATPPNAIVFASGHVEMGRMIRTGIILNLVGVTIVTATFYLIARPLFGIDVTTIPDWAR